MDLSWWRTYLNGAWQDKTHTPPTGGIFDGRDLINQRPEDWMYILFFVIDE